MQSFKFKCILKKLMSPLCIEKGLHLGQIALRKIINRFLPDFNQAFCSDCSSLSSRERLEKTQTGLLASGIGHSSSMHFLVGRVSFFSTVWQRGITCLLPTINLGSINPRRARKLLFVITKQSTGYSFLDRLRNFLHKFT